MDRDSLQSEQPRCRLTTEEEQQQFRWFENQIPELVRLQQNDRTFTHLSLNCESYYNRQLFYRCFGQALTGNTHLRELTLQRFEVGDSEDARFLAQCIGQTKVRSLIFRYYENPDQPFFVSRLLCEIVNTRSSLTTLIVGGSFIDAGLRFFGSNDLILLAQAVSRNTNIERLILDSCGLLDERDMEVLFAQGLRHNTTVTTFGFSSGRIDNDGVRLMVEHWHPNSPINYLDLRYNDIGPTGAQMLMHAARGHPALTKLCLEYNINIGTNGLRLIGEDLVSQPHLTYVDLNHCAALASQHGQPTEDEKRAVINAGQALLEAVKINHRIQLLDVRNNSLPADVETEINFYTRLNQTGRYLLSTNHGLSAAVWSLILAKCHNHCSDPSLIFFFLQEQPHLVRSFPPSYLQNY